MDFYDLKGVIEALLDGLAHRRREATNRSSIPRTIRAARRGLIDRRARRSACWAKCIRRCAKRFDFPDQPVLAGELDFEALLAVAPDVVTHRRCAALPGGDRRPGADRRRQESRPRRCRPRSWRQAWARR